MKQVSFRSFYERMILRTVATLGIAAAIVMSWWMRVEDVRERNNLPEMALDDTIGLGKFALTPLALAFETGENGESQLVLRARMENLTGETQLATLGFPSVSPKIETLDPPAADPDIYLNRDGERLQDLQPRMPEEVSIIWKTPPEWRPNMISIIFFRQNFKLRDNLYGQSSWLGFEPSARLTVPLGRTS